MDLSADILARVDRVAAEHGFRRQGITQPAQGATNGVVFVRRGDHTVVFKVFCETERKERECFALRHWRSTGLVPELIWDVDATTIAMSYVPGIWPAHGQEVESNALWRQTWCETGRAAGLLSRVPLSPSDQGAFESRFYGGLGSLKSYLGRVLELGRSIHARDPDFHDAFWRGSLDFMESNMDRILVQPQVLYHQDFANFHVEQGRFCGFFDLEMCRVGCAAMQLGAALAAFDAHLVVWGLFREGWEVATGGVLTPGDLSAALAARQFLGWREISRYLSYDGTPGTGYAWASPADPCRYRRSFEMARSSLLTGQGDRLQMNADGRV